MKLNNPMKSFKVEHTRKKINTYHNECGRSTSISLDCTLKANRKEIFTLMQEFIVEEEQNF